MRRVNAHIRNKFIPDAGQAISQNFPVLLHAQSTRGTLSEVRIEKGFLFVRHLSNQIVQTIIFAEMLRTHLATSPDLHVIA